MFFGYFELKHIRVEISILKIPSYKFPHWGGLGGCAFHQSSWGFKFRSREDLIWHRRCHPEASLFEAVRISSFHYSKKYEMRFSRRRGCSSQWRNYIGLDKSSPNKRYQNAIIPNLFFFIFSPLSHSHPLPLGLFCTRFMERQSRVCRVWFFILNRGMNTTIPLWGEHMGWFIFSL